MSSAAEVLRFAAGRAEGLIVQDLLAAAVQALPELVAAHRGREPRELRTIARGAGAVALGPDEPVGMGSAELAAQAAFGHEVLRRLESQNRCLLGPSGYLGAGATRPRGLYHPQL